MYDIGHDWNRGSVRMARAPTAHPHGILSLTANNASPFTGDGTNTYLIGGAVLAVIDPGPHDAAHTDAILAAAGGRPVTHILLTHAHRDHVDGLAELKRRTGAKTYGLGRPRTQDRLIKQVGAQSPSGGDFIDLDFVPDVHLEHGETVSLAGAILEAIHTPGHAPDHLCFSLVGTPALFSGDHVMGWNTSVIAPPEGHMGDYLRSLELLLARTETLYLPGHGGGIEDGLRTVRAYLLHRQMRENAVLAAVKRGAVTIPEIAAIVYSGIAPHLLNAARLSVQAHVEHLRERSLLTFEQPLTLDQPLALSS
jgi:glyoxylase-like metal-dependent hydrolase (beta-lactamase superfamily II)